MKKLIKTFTLVGLFVLFQSLFAADVTESDLDEITDSVATKCQLETKEKLQLRKQLKLQLRTMSGKEEKSVVIDSTIKAIKKGASIEDAVSLGNLSKNAYRKAIKSGEEKKVAKRMTVQACGDVATMKSQKKLRTSDSLESQFKNQYKKQVRTRAQKKSQATVQKAEEEKKQIRTRTRRKNQTGSEENGKRRGGSKNSPSGGRGR